MTAPVTFVTGLPGNGKTLYSLCMVKEWAEKEKRAVYYHGIEIIDKQALPWTEFTDPTTWHTLPVGSIIVIDEAHKVFPLRPQGSKVPPHVEAIAELRHQGHNLVLITQHPMEVDSAIRRRCGRHLHAVRRFGLQACAIFEWARCVDNCDKTRKDAIQHEWVYRKEAYAWYKSAEVHTIKRKLPKKLLILAVAPLLVIAAVWYVWRIFDAQHTGQTTGTAPQVSSAASSPTAQGRPTGGNGGPMTRQEWLERYQPRVQGLDYTAPVYDEVTKPTHAPYPAACIQSRTRCQCYTQQGTRLDVPRDLCKGIAEGGFFMAWDEKSQQTVPVARPQPESKLEGGNMDAVGINAGYQPQRAPFQSGQAQQVEQDPARPRANRSKPG